MSKKNVKLQKIQKIQNEEKKLKFLVSQPHQKYVSNLTDLRLIHAPDVGYKNASLGELSYLIRELPQQNLETVYKTHSLFYDAEKIATPLGFALSNAAFLLFLQHNQLDNWIQKSLNESSMHDVQALQKVSEKIQEKILNCPMPRILEQAITESFEQLCVIIEQEHQTHEQNSMTMILQNTHYQSASKQPLIFAVRSSLGTEDLKHSAQAGHSQSFLNVQGLENILLHVKKIFASVYDLRLILQRYHQKIQHIELAVTIQQMVRSDLATSGVIFTLDTESGFTDLVLLTASYGLGEAITKGLVNPDEFYVFKPTLLNKPEAQSILRQNLGSKLVQMQLADVYSSSNVLGDLTKISEVAPKERHTFSLTQDEVKQLAYYACLIEKHYGCAMDIEWAKDAFTQKLYILQARPETVKTQEQARKQQGQAIEKYHLKNTQSQALCQGRAIGQKISTGIVRVLGSLKEADAFEKGEILVTEHTDASWEPVMQKAAAVITNRGGRTSHAAIIARELGIPAVVGCENATEILKNKQLVTVSCAQGDEGFIYDGLIDFEIRQQYYENPSINTPFNLMMNIQEPELAFEYAQLPNHGAGLVRIEYILNHLVGVHPNAILAYPNVDDDLKKAIQRVAAGYPNPEYFYRHQLKSGISCIAAAFYPKPVIVRLCDFSSANYRKLMGGARYEPDEANAMLGLRGVSRYLSQEFMQAFELECMAIYQAIVEMGFDNIQIMVPFVRTLEQAQKITQRLSDYGFKELGTRILMMCELPINALLAEDFLQYFDGLSIGTNDLTQLTLGLDYDSGVAAVRTDFNEQNQAVKHLMQKAITACHAQNKYIGVCGRALSNDDALVKWFIEQGVNSISFNADSIMQIWQNIKG